MSRHSDVRQPSFLLFLAYFPIYFSFVIMIRVRNLRQEHPILRVSHLSFLEPTVTIFVYLVWI